MKLYEAPPSPSSRRVSIFLKEIGVDVPREAIDIRGGDNLKEEFQAISVSGKVPTLLLDNGDSLSESVAICRYFDALHDHKGHLFGETPYEQASIEMWHRVLELDGLYLAFQAFRNLSGAYSDRERCVKAWGDESKLRVEEFLPKLEKRLEVSAYIAGDKFSIVDITGFLFVGVCIKALEIEVYGKYPAIKAWHETLAQREAFQA